MGDVIIFGRDYFWENKTANIKLVTKFARRAATSKTVKDRLKNLTKMKLLVNYLNNECQLYAPVLYPMTPQKCGFRGSVSHFNELVGWITTNPAAVMAVENW